MQDTLTVVHNAKNGVFKILGNMTMAIIQKTGAGIRSINLNRESGVTLWIRRKDGNIVLSGDVLTVIQVTFSPAAGRIIKNYFFQHVGLIICPVRLTMGSSIEGK